MRAGDERRAALEDVERPPRRGRQLVGSDFRFRAAGGVYKIWIYGSGVDLFAVGNGKVTLQGMPDSSTSDGWYSINGGDRHSLPTAPSDLLPVALPVSSNG